MNEKTLQILVAVGGLATTGIALSTWGFGFIDPLFATEQEVQNMIDTTNQQYFNHFSNMMIEEQISDAQEEIWTIEDLEDAGTATPADLRKKQRLEQSIERAKKKCLPEDTQDHSHDCQ